MSKSAIGLVFWITFIILGFVFYIIHDVLDKKKFFDDKKGIKILDIVNYIIIIILIVYNIIAWIYSMLANKEKEEYEKNKKDDLVARRESEKSQDKANLLNKISLKISISYLILMIIGVLIIGYIHRDQIFSPM